MKWIIASAVWPIALAAIPAKSLLFYGQIHVWPFLLLACALAARCNWRAAVAVGLGIALSEFIYHRLEQPSIYQFAMYATLSFIAYLYFDIVAALALAIVAFIFLVETFGYDWRMLMIASEVVLVASLSASVLNGPSGGTLQPVERRTPAHKVVAYPAALWRRAVRHRESF